MQSNVELECIASLLVCYEILTVQDILIIAGDASHHAGYGASCDAYHITSPDPQGDGLRRAILAALRDGSIQPHEVHIQEFSLHMFVLVC